MQKRFLVICDSFGTNYCGISYPSILANLDHTVDTIEAAGESIAKALDKVIARQPFASYDCIILQVGSPDFHPRMPRRLLSYLKKTHPTIARDSFWCLPPKPGLKYLIKLPLFLVRSLLIHAKYETLTSTEQFQDTYTRLYALISKSGEQIIVIPPFAANSILYGNQQINRTNHISEWLQLNFPEQTLTGSLVSHEFYKNSYAPDFFHLNEEYHKLLARTILDEASRNDRRHPIQKEPVTCLNLETVTDGQV